MLLESYRVLDRLRLPHGLYVASPSTHYRYVWIRDCVYMSLPYANKSCMTYEKAFHRLFDLWKEYEWKLDIAIRKKPSLSWEYLHARYEAYTVTEIHDQEWGHIQHDMIGAFLFGVGLGIRNGKRLLRTDDDRRVLHKLVQYLQSVEYWHDPDNGMWEEWREVHASSVGACVAGLRMVAELVSVPDELIAKGEETLHRLFPRESRDKAADLAQLSLVYPYRVFTGALGAAIVEQAERELLRTRGLIRYKGDSYYSLLEAEHGRELPRSSYIGTEAEWTFGLPWLALCHWSLGNREKALSYLRKTERLMTVPGELPELYYAGTDRPNPNSPLGWSSAMYILAKEEIEGGAAVADPVSLDAGGRTAGM